MNFNTIKPSHELMVTKQITYEKAEELLTGIDIREPSDGYAEFNIKKYNDFLGQPVRVIGLDMSDQTILVRCVNTGEEMWLKSDMLRKPYKKEKKLFKFAKDQEIEDEEKTN
jgi:hypothetical protein